MLTTQKIQIYYYFEFPTRHPYKICWFEFWVRRPKRLALVAATAARSEAAADAAAATTAGKAGEAGAFVAEASPRRVPRAQRRRRPRRVSYRRTEISGFELSDLNENEVK